MENSQYLLIGGGLAAHQAVKQIRQLDSKTTITLVGEEDHVPYDRPPLSKEFLRGDKARDQLFYDPKTSYLDQDIDLLLATSVQHLHLPEKTARLSNGRTIRFDKALIATGGRPVRLAIPGSDLPGVHYLRTMDDADAILAHVSPGVRAVAIGAGFIGLEIAASLTQLGVHVTVIESQSHIWPRFADRALAETMQRYCSEKGVVFRTSETVQHIERHHDRIAVSLASGLTLPCHFVVIAIGIAPNVELARDAGLAVTNGIVVDEFMQTSHPDIYAAGDIVNYIDPIFEKRRRVEHWGHAEYTGQIAGKNMAGQREAYDLVTYVWSDIFDLHLEFAGDESEHDEVLLRGQLETMKFTQLYLENKRLRAYFSINAGAKDFQPMQQLIRSKKDLSGYASQLQDPAVPVKTLTAK
jgi:3-phenylpropionate/trans-cinnamate dioxygenase ferredoxin reductase component